jgi:hypothetical protein
VPVEDRRVAGVLKWGFLGVYGKRLEGRGPKDHTQKGLVLNGAFLSTLGRSARVEKEAKGDTPPKPGAPVFVLS